MSHEQAILYQRIGTATYAACFALLSVASHTYKPRQVEDDEDPALMHTPEHEAYNALLQVTKAALECVRLRGIGTPPDRALKELSVAAERYEDVSFGKAAIPIGGTTKIRDMVTHLHAIVTARTTHELDMAADKFNRCLPEGINTKTGAPYQL